jgi:hypothetical protein
MTAMSRTVKSAIFFSVIGIATGVGIMLLIIDDQTLRGIFRPLVGESSNNKLEDNAFHLQSEKTTKRAIILYMRKGKDLGNINCQDSNVKNHKIGNNI